MSVLFGQFASDFNRFHRRVNGLFADFDREYGFGSALQSMDLDDEWNAPAALAAPAPSPASTRPATASERQLDVKHTSTDSKRSAQAASTATSVAAPAAAASASEDASTSNKAMATAPAAGAESPQTQSQARELSPWAGFGGLGLDLFSRRDLFAAQPKMDLTESKEGFTVHADLPGVPKENVKVTLKNGLLTISGERREEKRSEDKERSFHRVERSFGSVSRSVRLPRNADVDKIAATHDNGVLTIQIPKLAPLTDEATQARNITVG